MSTAQVGGSAIPVLPTNVDKFDSYEANAKRAIAMVADSLKSMDVSFVEHQPYRYDLNTPSRPALSHPLTSTRLGGEKSDQPDEMWQGNYDELLDSLPNDLKQWVQSQNKLSFYVRDPNFYVFNSLLVLTAKALAFVDKANQPQPPDSAMFLRAQENLLTPFVAAKAAILQGNETVKLVMANWQQIGRNDPDFEKNVNYVQQTGKLINAFEAAFINFAKDPPVKGSYEMLQKIAQQIELLQEQYHSTSAGKDLRILGDTIDTLAMVTSALLLGYGPSSAHMMLTLGMPSKLSDASWQQMVNQITDGLTTGLDPGRRALLNGAMQMLMIVTVGATLGIADKGIAFAPKFEASLENKVNLLSLELTAKLVFNAHIFQNIIHALATQMTAHEKSQALIENSLMLATFATVLMSVNENRPGFAGSLFDTLNQDIGKAIDKVNAGLESNSDPQLKGLKIYLQQAAIALENGNLPAFTAAYQGLMESMNIPVDQLKGEFEQINQLGKFIMQAFVQSPEEAQALTTIQAA